MKTDVIFLGAGASATAGFPTNEGLANYIFEKLSQKNRDVYFQPKRFSGNLNALREATEDMRTHVARLREHWRATAETFRAANCLSVDEYCEISAPTANLVPAMKQVLRQVLFDHAAGWWKPSDYRRLVASLFKASEVYPDNRFTLVNFNYDGLLTKLLTDAIHWRCLRSCKPVPDFPEMAAIGGGYYQPQVEDDTPSVVQSAPLKPDQFYQHLPHGTVTVALNMARGLRSLQNLFYSRTERPDRETLFLAQYDSEPMIHFPWEPNGRRTEHKRQYEHAAMSVKEAKRIHFIGLSGHPLLRHSLKDVFAATSRDELLQKQWHVATTEKDAKRVARKLMDCFLSDDLRRDEDFCMDLASRFGSYPGFREWLDVAPHLNG